MAAYFSLRVADEETMFAVYRVLTCAQAGAHIPEAGIRLRRKPTLALAAKGPPLGADRRSHLRDMGPA